MSYRRIEDPERLHAVIDAILSIEVDVALTGLLGSIVEQAVGLVGARYGALGVLTAEGDQLAEFITIGIDDQRRDAIGHVPIGKGLLGEVISRREPIRIDNISAAPERSGFPANHPVMTSFLGVPVHLEAGRIFGNLYLCDKLDGETFSDEDRVLVETLGRAAGLLIDKARMQAQLQDLALADERERIARDLHDTVIQRLFAVGLSLQSATRRETSTEISAKIDHAIDDLDATIREIRTTIFAISQPTIVGSPSLRRRILDVCDDAAGQFGLDLKVAIEGPIEEIVSSQVATSLLAALRETLSNVVRHAEATRAEIEVTVGPEGLCLVVSDDGTGVPRERRPGGRGITNLTERAEALGGSCEIRDGTERGTVLTWTITEVGRR